MTIDHTQSSYPPAPWRLRGEATCFLQVVDTSLAREMVPEALSIVPVFPGKTVGGMYLSRYQEGSVLEYNELIVVPAMVWYRGRIGAWVSHIYVDDAASIAGGREIWGLPKERATFGFLDDLDRKVTVRKNGDVLCTLRLGAPNIHVRLPVILPAFGRKEELLWFRGSGSARVGVTSAAIEIPPESPFALLGSGRKFSLHCRDLDLDVYPPSPLFD